MMEELEADLRARGRADNVLTLNILATAAFFFVGYALAATFTASLIGPGMRFGELTTDDRTMYLYYEMIAWGALTIACGLLFIVVLFAGMTRHKGDKGPEVMAEEMVGIRGSVMIDVFILAGLAGCIVVDIGRGGDLLVLGPFAMIALHLLNEVRIYLNLRKKVAET